MQIYSLECRHEQRSWLRLALELVGRPYALLEAGDLNEALAGENLAEFRLALLPSNEFERNPDIFELLREMMPAARVLAYGEFHSGDAAIQRRMKECGADIVLDWRVSPTKLALLLKRFFWHSERPAVESAPLMVDSIRHGVRLVAPSAA